MNLLACLFLLAFWCVSVHGHVYHLGRRCPKAPSVREFDMSKFLGIWYVVERSSPSADCMVYNFTQPDPAKRPDVYQVRQTSKVMGHKIVYTGTVTAPGRGSHKGGSHMTVEYPLNPGKASFDIFDTDYSTFAGIYTCQPLMVLVRQSVTLLSRTKDLDHRTLREMKNKLNEKNIFSMNLKKNRQNHCGKDCFANIPSSNATRHDDHVPVEHDIRQKPDPRAHHITETSIQSEVTTQSTPVKTNGCTEGKVQSLLDREPTLSQTLHEPQNTVSSVESMDVPGASYTMIVPDEGLTQMERESIESHMDHYYNDDDEFTWF